MSPRLARPRNDPRQYDDLAGEWWRPGGAFTALHWLAAARARLIPETDQGVLVDLACGAGLMAPHVDGYTHVGVDLTASALTQAADRGVHAAQGDVAALPLADAAADVVVAGEILEHVTDLDTVIAEAARVLRPGGTLVCDTLNDNALSRFLAVSVAERIPGAAPPGIHDPDLFVDPRRLRRLCAAHGIGLRVWGLRPRLRDLPGFVASQRRRPVRLVPMRAPVVLYQGLGIKEGGAT